VHRKKDPLELRSKVPNSAICMFIALVVVLPAFLLPIFATASSCYQDRKREPVGGKWKGFFRLTHEMKYPVAAPPMHISGRAISILFSVARRCRTSLLI
jgi:hypothetical protein